MYNLLVLVCCYRSPATWTQTV